MYVPSEFEVSLAARCVALRGVLPPDSIFGELTAAALHGWWLPPLPTDLPMSVLVEPDTVRPRRAGVRARRVALTDDERCLVDGVAVTSAVRTLRDLASSLCLVDLVVLADSAVRLGQCSPDEIRASSESAGRGARAFRRLADLVDARSESPWESVLRLLHVLPGLPPVKPQADLTDEYGTWVARADLWLVGTARLHECDGEHHRDRARHGHDLAREERLTRARYERYGYTTREILLCPGAILRDAENAFGLDHDRDRLTTWLDEIRPSLFTPAGRARLVRRWVPSAR